MAAGIRPSLLDRERALLVAHRDLEDARLDLRPHLFVDEGEVAGIERQTDAPFFARAERLSEFTLGKLISYFLMVYLFINSVRMAHMAF